MTQVLARADTLLLLQQTIGNQAVLSLIRYNLIAGLEPETPEAPEAEPPVPTSPGNWSSLMRRLPAWWPHLFRCGATRPTSSDPASDPPPAPAGGERRVDAFFIVEDDAALLARGQMRKSDFLLELRRAVSASAAAAIAGTVWSDMDCPYIERWFEYYGGQNSRRIEQAVRRYAAQARSAASAREYILIVSATVARSVSKWRSLGN
jgi:hypothetical protein